MAFDPRRYGHFVKEDRCNCLKSQLRAIKFSKIKSYVNDNRATEMGDLASPGGYWIPANYVPFENNTHALSWKCCAKAVHVAMRHEFGQYTNIYSSEELTGINATANVVDIDNVFSEMGETIGHEYANSKTGINTTAYENTDNLFSEMSD
uniref:Astacin domain-containing protein n=1 Tax=Globodera pallida TaxID=36090 RepID=A0A183BMH6_GLOPA